MNELDELMYLNNKLVDLLKVAPGAYELVRFAETLGYELTFRSKQEPIFNVPREKEDREVVPSDVNQPTPDSEPALTLTRITNDEQLQTLMAQLRTVCRLSVIEYPDVKTRSVNYIVRRA